MSPRATHNPYHPPTEILFYRTEASSFQTRFLLLNSLKHLYLNKAIYIGASDFIVKSIKPKELNYKAANHIRSAEQIRLFKDNLKATWVIRRP